VVRFADSSHGFGAASLEPSYRGFAFFTYLSNQVIHS